MMFTPTYDEMRIAEMKYLLIERMYQIYCKFGDHNSVSSLLFNPSPVCGSEVVHFSCEHHQGVAMATTQNNFRV